MGTSSGEYIGTLEAEKRYRIGMGTLRKKAAAGLLQSYADPWDSRRRLYKVSELEALLYGTPQPAEPLTRATRK